MHAPNRKIEVKPSNLDDPDYAAFAWARYWRLMRFMLSAVLAFVIALLVFIHLTGDPLPIHFYIAIGLGAMVACSLAAALMGLVFLSSGTGHDEAIDEQIGIDDEEESSR